MLAIIYRRRLRVPPIDRIISPIQFRSPQNADFLRPFSTKKKTPPVRENASEESFTVSYLINTWGLSEKDAVLVSSKIHLESPEKPDAVLNLLRQYGFTHAHIPKLVTRWPKVLFSCPEQNLTPKLEFFRSLGIPLPVLADKLSGQPSVLTRSLKHSIIPSYNFLKGLLKSDERVARVFSRATYTFGRCSLDGLSSNVSMLKERGIPLSSIVHMVNHPQTLLVVKQKLETYVDLAVKMGFNVSTSTFAYAVKVFVELGESNLKRKMDIFKRCGWSEADVACAIRRFPNCMNVSEEKIVANMSFLVKELGREPGDVAQCPVLLNLSLERRMRPRCVVAGILGEKNLLKGGKVSSLNTLLKLSEKDFLKNYVVKYEKYVPELLDIYQGKLSPSGPVKLVIDIVGIFRWLVMKMRLLITGGFSYYVVTCVVSGLSSEEVVSRECIFGFVLVFSYCFGYRVVSFRSLVLCGGSAFVQGFSANCWAVMVERRKRKPLVLSSTRAILNLLLNPRETADESDEIDEISAGPRARTPAGILRVSEGATVGSLDASVLVGLSTAMLKRLSITSGSLLLIKNVDANVSKIGQAVVLDPPSQCENPSEGGSICARAPYTMLVFPSYPYPQNHSAALDPQVAYLSPILAFNLNLHLSCLKSVVQKGKETLLYFFKMKADGEINGNESKLPSASVEIQSYGELPKYASHLRATFVKVPECGTLERLKTRSSDEAKDRQELIDAELNDYFSIDRYLSRGDLFSISINWNCKSEMCILCSQNTLHNTHDIIYFKVAAMEPSEEPVLRVNRSQTALVLGGASPSAVPPDPLIPRSKNISSLQEDAVLALASVLAPALCPSAFTSKFRVSVLLHGASGCGKRTVIRCVARHLGLHVVEYSCHNFVTSSEKKTSIALAEAFNTARRYCPTILLLRRFEVFRNLAAQEGSSHEQAGVNSEVASVIKQFTEPIINDDEEEYVEENLHGDSVYQFKASEMVNQHPVLLVATADNSEGLPATIRRCFTHEIKMEALNEEQRSQLLTQSFQHISELLPNISIEDLVKDIVGQTSGFTPRDLRALIADAGANLIIPKNEKMDPEKSKHFSVDSDSTYASCKINDAPTNVGKENLIKALERSKKRNASALGTPKVPNVKWDDVGGLEDVKKSILDTIQLPLIHKDLFSSGLRKRSGVLLYGPPGTGKARTARPCVIFFDELDSLAPARGASGDSGGVMDRVVSQDLFIIGASNRPDLIDPALLRPGRFDKLLYVGVNSEASYRERVLKALTRKFKLHEDVSLYEIAQKCPINFTGADMYALCADAWFHAAKRKASYEDSESGLTHKSDAVEVEYEDFVEV
ncbi:peroxisomal biogenesis factor [Striga asiatica]|uniref:Peroxisomal biogenesis factor n=1 Tax=Striga asiatica TaxID=4170 RepID=A0A5A7NWD3_STRAF|nr:peroxisomal biogenesis factor [Striga asiatica]